MKRKVVLVAGIAALAVGLYVGSRVGAGPTEGSAPAPSGSTRVSVMNMQKVAAEYTRTGVLRKDIEKMATDLDEPIKKLQAQAQPLTQPASNAQDAEDKQKKLVSLRRQIEDMTNDAKKKLTEKTAQGEQDIYKDIEAAVYALSRDRGIDLVLYYNDVTDAAMKYNAQALTKRISTSGMPIYTGQGTEITDQVVRVLNFNWERNHPTPKASGQ